MSSGTQGRVGRHSRAVPRPEGKASPYIGKLVQLASKVAIDSIAWGIATVEVPELDPEKIDILETCIYISYVIRRPR